MPDDFKSYEISFLLKDPEGEKAILDLINQYKGQVIHRGQLKEVKLSYPIKKQSSAYFGFVQFGLVPTDIDKISQSLKLNPQILRYLSISPPIIKKERKFVGREVAKSPVAPQAVLTNEALEEKLEEILQ